MRRLYANTTPFYRRDLSICILEGVLEPTPPHPSGDTEVLLYFLPLRNQEISSRSFLSEIIPFWNNLMRLSFLSTSPTTGFTIYFLLRILCSVCLHKGSLGGSLPPTLTHWIMAVRKFLNRCQEGVTLEVGAERDCQFTCGPCLFSVPLLHVQSLRCFFFPGSELTEKQAFHY